MVDSESKVQETEPKAPEAPDREPLPIWFFVGLILAVYGVLVIGGSALGDSRATVLSEMRAGLWWGGLMTVFGAFFAWVGWRMHAKKR